MGENATNIHIDGMNIASTHQHHRQHIKRRYLGGLLKPPHFVLLWIQNYRHARRCARAPRPRIQNAHVRNCDGSRTNGLAAGKNRTDTDQIVDRMHGRMGAPKRTLQAIKSIADDDAVRMASLPNMFRINYFRKPEEIERTTDEGERRKFYLMPDVFISRHEELVTNCAECGLEGRWRTVTVVTCNEFCR